MKTPVEPLERVIAELAKLPGVGRRSAERMAYHLLAASERDAMALAVAVRDLKKKLRACRVCGAIAEGELCVFCSDPGRDRSTICAVETQRDALALEETGAYRGLYHVLGGKLSPVAGTGPEQLAIEPLLARLTAEVRELILATNPDLEGDGTASFLAALIAKGAAAKVSRLARGLSAGGQIELAGRDSLGAAIANRQPVSAEK
jgi:recombination protein RecR